MLSRFLRSNPLRTACRPSHARSSLSPAAAAVGSDSGERLGRLAVLAAATCGFIVLTAEEADACGIIGVVGSDKAKEILLEGLAILKNRGYDSVGIATISADKQLKTTKFASVGSTADSLDLLTAHCQDHNDDKTGIGHTRWATHGGKTDYNAHPHGDMKDRIALVHNGTITNCSELRAALKEKGVVFKSETDTEVIAQLIGQELDTGVALRVAVDNTLKQLEGTWGLCIMHKETPDEIIVARNGSPLVLGVGDKCMYIASETTAFNRHTKSFISLKDGEVATVRPDGSNLDLRRVEVAPDQDIKLSPAPYPHWTIRELMEQPQAIAQALGFGGRMQGDRVVLGGLDMDHDRFMSVQNLLIAACGTSLHAGMYGAKLMRDLGAFNTVSCLDAAEFTTTSVAQEAGGLLVVSQSGETKDVHRALVLGMGQGAPALSVVNAVGSLIARTTGRGVYLNAGRENAVASTKAFTTQVTVMALISCWFSQYRTDATHFTEQRHALLEALQRLPISFGMAIRLNDQCKEIAKKLVNKRDMFVLGKGLAEPVALEGALKIKEISYIHAEGYSGGALKHGPFALIEDFSGEYGATPIIMFILDDQHATHMRTAAHEVRARGATVIAVTDKRSLAEGVSDDIIEIPSNGALTALIGVLPLQMIAYHLAVMKGIDPDVPRNLAKSVTVD